MKNSDLSICCKCNKMLAQKEISYTYKGMCLCKDCYKDVTGDDSQKVDVGKFLAECESSSNFSEGFFEETYKIVEKGVQLVLEDGEKEDGKKDNVLQMTPKDIVAYLDRFIIGQESAKKTLAVAINNHYRRINTAPGNRKLPRNNVLIQGPTGCGKTEMLRILAKLVDIPLYIADASSFTSNSFKGKDAENLITELYSYAGEDLEKTEKAIVYLDEFDKLSTRFGISSSGVSQGEEVQKQMLKIIEGMDFVYSKKNITINTENILFICGGAFDDLVETKKKKEATGALGFTSDKNEEEKPALNEVLTPEDFIEYGIVPEMMGRLPIIAIFDALTEDDLVNILCNKEDSLISGYKAMMKEVYDVELEFSDSALSEIAHQAYIRKIGARGLNAVVEKVMQDILYEVPSNPSIRKCFVTRGVVLGTEDLQLTRERTKQIEQAPLDKERAKEYESENEDKTTMQEVLHS